MSGIRSAKAMMALSSLFLFIVCTATVVSANGKHLLCSTGSKETSEAEGDIEFLSASVNNTFGECRVTIYYPPHDEIELTLINVSKTYPCEEGDYIEIYSSIYSQYRTRLARYCIRDAGLVNGNKETLRLKRNAVMIRRYYKVSPSNELLPEIATKMRVHYRKMRYCRYILKAETGAFSSPSYPDFSLNSECEWRIYTQGGATIQLTFYNVELSANCNGSFIEVTDVDNERTQICGKHLTKTIQSKSSELVIRMTSTTDSAVRFKATYREIPKCRIVELNGASEFKTPKGKLCVKWVLTAFVGQIAALSFSHFNLDSTSAKSCSGNVVEVWDGDSTKVYCNSNAPPVIIRSLNGRNLTVTYRWTGSWDASSSFHASFTSVSPAKYNANCFVQNMALYFRCSRNDLPPISCDFLCDGAMQCPDNSDEDSCDQKDDRWHKLQVFVIVMGTICASTVTFCVGVVCFRKFTSQTGRISDSYGRQLSTSDQATLTPNVDLPSPPPRYFNNSENNLPSVIRGTYFFGNEFSQSGIHSAFLFGIPPPRYRSTESLQPLCADGNHGDGQWQGEMTNMASRQTSVCGDETQSNLQQGEQSVSGVSSGDVNSTATEAVPLVHCCSIADEGKENKKLSDSGIENQEVGQQINESTQATSTTESNGTSISHSDDFNPMYV